MEQLGYFLFMENQEREQKEREFAAVGKDKVNSDWLLVAEQTTQDEE